MIGLGFGSRVRLVCFIYVAVRRVKRPYSIEEMIDYPLPFQDLPCLLRVPATHLRVISSTVKRRPSNAGDKLFAAPRVIHVKRGLWILPHDFAQQSRFCKSVLVVRSNSCSTWRLMEPKTRKRENETQTENEAATESETEGETEGETEIET